MHTNGPNANTEDSGSSNKAEEMVDFYRPAFSSKRNTALTNEEHAVPRIPFRLLDKDFRKMILN